MAVETYSLNTFNGYIVTLLDLTIQQLNNKTIES